MGSVVPRPTDPITEVNLLAGLPFVEFSPSLSGGGFGAALNLGILDTAALEKSTTLQQLKDFGSGSGKLVRELVGELEATLKVGVFNWEAAVFRYAIASATLTDLSAGNTTETAEAINLTGADDASGDIMIDLLNRSLNDGFGAEITTLVTRLITDEAVGTGTGTTFGDTSGDFSLDFAIAGVAADITTYIETLNGVPNDRTADLVDGAPVGTGDIGIVVGTGATSGDIEYFANEGPIAGTVITVTYTPHSASSFVENTDFTVDPVPGRIRIPKPGAVAGLRDLQPMAVTYDYDGFTGKRMTPLTQEVFQGKCMLQHLPDVGVNFIWTIPKCSIRITDDELGFSKEGFAVLPIAIQLLDDGTTEPFGHIDFYDENAA